MAHTISQERAGFLDENFTGFGFIDASPDKALFDTITSSAELHYLADIYNWDDGPEVLGWIIDSPYCDRGTAALLFWRAEPDFYTDYTDESEISFDDGILPLLQRLMQHWEAGFYTRAQIAYDRRSDPGAEALAANYGQKKWVIPDYLISPTQGKPLLFA